MKKTSDHFLSLIIPVYKQEKTILMDLLRIDNALRKIRYNFEIIVIVDGVLDGTYFRLKKSKYVLQNKIRIFAYRHNRGKAYAIRTGMNMSRGDYVMFLDSGREIDPNGISILLEHMEWYGADIIVGSKRHLASYVHYPTERKILSYGYYFFVKILFGLKIHDTQAGIKVFRKVVLKSILPLLNSRQFAGDLEMLVAAESLGFTKIYEAPIKLDYQFSNITSAATIKSIIQILIDTLVIFYRKNVIRSYRRGQ